LKIKEFIVAAILGFVLFLVVVWASQILTVKAEATATTCPSGGDWVKVEPLSGKTYTYTPKEGCTVTENCYKHSTYVHFGTGATVTADFHCTDWEWWGCKRWTQYDLSHASFKLSCVEPSVTPTLTPTPTETQECKDCEPTPTGEPTPTPKEETCEGRGNDAQGHPCGWSEPIWTPPEYKPPVCTVEVPKLASNPQYSRTGDSVKITWEHDNTNLTKWNINYGTDKDNMPYGIPFLPKEAREITLNGLTWNGVTWVALCGWNTDMCQSCLVFDP
jgi:hypothetical protein